MAINNATPAINILRPFADGMSTSLVAANAAVRKLTEEAGESPRIGGLVTDAFLAQYRRVESRFVKPYTGESADPKIVWEHVRNGMAFPAFPYAWLPAGNHSWWWDIGSAFVRSCWVSELLIQSGWVQDAETGEWEKPASVVLE